jgi:hypothetical protein
MRNRSTNIHRFPRADAFCAVGSESTSAASAFKPRQLRSRQAPNLPSARLRFFDEDLERSQRVTYEEWQNRSWTEKLSERAEAWLNSQL